MKFTKILFSMLCVLAILQGCNTVKKDKDEVENKTEEVKDKTKNSLEGHDYDDRARQDYDSLTEKDHDMAIDDEDKADVTGEKLPHNFLKFELKTEYADQKHYKAEYKKEHDHVVKAHVKDDVYHKTTFKGKEAFTQLKPKLEKLSFDKSTPEDEVIKHVLETFSLKSDYTFFELKVKFTDGTEKTYTK